MDFSAGDFVIQLSCYGSKTDSGSNTNTTHIVISFCVLIHDIFLELTVGIQCKIVRMTILTMPHPLYYAILTALPIIDSTGGLS